MWVCLIDTFGSLGRYAFFVLLVIDRPCRKGPGVLCLVPIQVSLIFPSSAVFVCFVLIFQVVLFCFVFVCLFVCFVLQRFFFSGRRVSFQLCIQIPLISSWYLLNRLKFFVRPSIAS